MATIKVKQVRSRIGAPKTQKLTLDALGLTKMNKGVECQDNASVRGRIKKVQHLVAIVEE